MLGGKWERFFLILVLLIHSGVSASTAQIHYLNTSVFFLLYGTIFILALPDIGRWLSNFPKHIFLFLMIIWAVSSIIWTTSVYLTLLGSVSLFGMLLISFYLFDKYTMEEILDLLVYVGFISLFLNIIVMLCFPGFSRHEHVEYPRFGSWKGLFGNPNHLGIFFCLSSVVFLFALYFKRPINKTHLYLAFFLSIILLFQSNSTTSWIVMGLFVGLFGLKWLNAKKNVQWRWIFIGLFIITSGTVFWFEHVLALFGRDLTFTGRSDIWIEVWSVIQKKLLLGNGYLGFWYDEAHKISFGPVHYSSHSGYLEIIVYFGFIGLFLFLMMWGRALFLSAKLFFSNQMTLQSIFPFLFILTYSIQNTMESSFFLQRNLLWILFIYFIIYLNNNHSRQQSP